MPESNYEDFTRHLMVDKVLAILKVVELNHRWLDIWLPKMASNDLQQAANDPCESGELDLVA